MIVGRKPMQEEPSEALDALAHSVIGAALEVHRVLGPGFLECVYEEALCVELGLRDIPLVSQHPVRVNYKGTRVGEGRLDLLVADALIVELKAVETLLPVHSAQLHSYLKATGYRLGLLINFNVPLLRDGIKLVILKTS
jgi:GxxExxY protein